VKAPGRRQVARQRERLAQGGPAILLLSCLRLRRRDLREREDARLGIVDVVGRRQRLGDPPGAGAPKSGRP
jgi:hypothetical protein